VLQYSQLLSAALNTAAGALVPLCTVQVGQTAATLDLVTCNQVKNYITASVNTSEQIKAEASSSDTWAVMKTKLASIVGGNAAAVFSSNPTVAADITGVTSIFTQILGVQ